jgi:hypothetical protein
LTSSTSFRLLSLSITFATRGISRRGLRLFTPNSKSVSASSPSKLRVWRP